MHATASVTAPGGHWIISCRQDLRFWGLLGLGPAVALVDYAFLTPGPSVVGLAGWMFRHFLMLAYLWAYWHLIRQHYGFLVLYRRKAEIQQDTLDTAFLWIGSAYPFLAFSLSEAYVRSGLPLALPTDWVAGARLILYLAAAVSNEWEWGHIFHLQCFAWKPTTEGGGL